MDADPNTVSTSLVTYDADHAVEQVKQVGHLVWLLRQTEFVEGRDYGVIPGTKKPSLWKPGAEKFSKGLGLAAEFETIDSVERWDSEDPFFHYRIRCSLRHIDSGKIVATGIGSCNSMEKKYRKQDTLSIVNTIDKIAQKRAFVGAVLIAANASDIFTQDIEDMPQFADKGGNGKKSTPGNGEQFTDDITHIETRLTDSGKRYYVLGGMILWTRQPLRELFSETDFHSFDVVLEDVGIHALPDPLRAAYRIEEYEGDMGEWTRRRRLLRLHRIKTGQTAEVRAAENNQQDTVTEDTIAGGAEHELVIFAAWDKLSSSDQDDFTKDEFWEAANDLLQKDPELSVDLLMEAARVVL